MWLRVVPYTKILSGTIFKSEIKHPINSPKCGEGKSKYTHQLCVVCQDNVHWKETMGRLQKNGLRIQENYQ